MFDVKECTLQLFALSLLMGLHVSYKSKYANSK